MKHENEYDSLTIADHFGKQHKDIIRNIESLIDELKLASEVSEIFGEPCNFMFEKIEKEYRGQVSIIYKMGKKELLLLSTKIPGIEALKYNMASIASLLIMEETLAENAKSKRSEDINTDAQIAKICNDFINFKCNPDILNTIQAEKLYHQRILLNFKKIFPEYLYIQSEYRMKDGDIVDILAEDIKTKRPVIIEIKVGSYSAHKQLRSYAYNLDNPILVNICHKKPNKQVDGIIYVEYA